MPSPPSTPSSTGAGSEVFGGPPPPVRPFLRLGSWVGGDQDGNPHARAKTLRDALRAQKQVVLSRYRDSVLALSVQYSQSIRWTGADPSLAASIADDEARMPEATHDLGERNRDEPYRRKLSLVHHRLEASLAQLQGGRAERPYSTARRAARRPRHGGRRPAPPAGARLRRRGPARATPSGPRLRLLRLLARRPLPQLPAARGGLGDPAPIRTGGGQPGRPRRGDGGEPAGARHAAARAPHRHPRAQPRRPRPGGDAGGDGTRPAGDLAPGRPRAW